MKKIIWLSLSFLILVALLLGSCSTSSITSTETTKTPTTAPTTTTIKTTAPITAPPTTTTNITKSTVGNWWDSLGTPQYGGEMVLRTNNNLANWDSYNSDGLNTITSAYMETLHGDDWTLNPAVFSYHISFRPSDYVVGLLAADWEFTDPNTYVVHLRQGIHWQNIPPANGREFVASDVVYHYDRLYGLGDGFTKVDPFHASDNEVGHLTSVVATDKYTVAFNWNTTDAEFIMETLQIVQGVVGHIECPDAVQQWGNLNDWHHAIGTGPFILQDFVDSSSALLVKNPNYWGYDERYPKNQLPYIDTLRILVIPDDATALAGLRTGKIDAVCNTSIQEAQAMQKTNPEVLQAAVPLSDTYTIDPRNDVKPFNDIRVREAMQMAIDLPTIAKTYYGGTTSPYPSSLISSYVKGWGFTYDQWPQDLKDQYAYNPSGAKQLLAQAGYPNGFKTDLVADNSGDMDLLQVVQSYFSAVGINMEIRPMDAASWQSYVRTGHKQDQLAFCSAGSLGFTFEPLRSINRFSTNYTVNWCLVNDPTFNSFLPKALAVTTVSDAKQVVSAADEYTAQQHYVISLLQPNLYNLYQPWLKGYNGQYQSLSGSSTSGPNLIGFYISRFWIDQKLKNSMGH